MPCTPTMQSLTQIKTKTRAHFRCILNGIVEDIILYMQKIDILRFLGWKGAPLAFPEMPRDQNFPQYCLFSKYLLGKSFYESQCYREKYRRKTSPWRYLQDCLFSNIQTLRYKTPNDIHFGFKTSLRSDLRHVDGPAQCKNECCSNCDAVALLKSFRANAELRKSRSSAVC